eukprot:320845-Rhodomonas_salina.1
MSRPTDHATPYVCVTLLIYQEIWVDVFWWDIHFAGTCAVRQEFRARYDAGFKSLKNTKGRLELQIQSQTQEVRARTTVRYAYLDYSGKLLGSAKHNLDVRTIGRVPR